MTDPVREALESMVWQFAYRTVARGRLALTTGCLSALEEAFEVLGWDDPHFSHECDEQCCQHPGCLTWATCGAPTPDGYKRLCCEHYLQLRS